MKDNYRITFDHHEPSREEIARRMDFDALLRQYKEAQPEPSVRLRQLRTRSLTYWVSAAAAILLLLVAGWFLFRPQTSQITEAEYFAAQPYVNPPLKTVPPPAAVVKKIDAYQGGVIEYPSGSRLVVPAQAFMDDRGSLIGGEVEIHYRELHDYIDFFVAGIPMNYDSAGLRYYLESAGMVEIFAEQNGQRIYLAPDKAIAVELVSDIVVPDFFTLPDYQVYQLDSANRNWVYRDVDHLQFLTDGPTAQGDDASQPRQRWLARLRDIDKTTERQMAELEAGDPLPPAPLRPERAAGNRPTLELDFLSGELALAPGSEVGSAELEKLAKGTIWEIAPESPAVDQRAFNVTWEQVRLRRLPTEKYELTLIHPENQVKLIVRPVLLGQDYDNALANYERQLADYNALVAARENRLVERRQALEKQLDQQRAELRREMEAALAQVQNDAAARNQLLRRRIVNRFTATSFGLWNCARPIRPELATIKVQYVDEAGNAVENRTAFVANTNQNTVYRFLAAEDARLSVDTQGESLLWVVTGDNELAVADPEALEALNKGKKSVTITLRPVSQPVGNESDLRKVLRFE